MTDESRVHKAVPSTMAQAESGVGYCDYCHQRVHRVPGGQGPTWVHTDTLRVGAPSDPTTPDWKERFLALYKAVADCEAPEGTQVDDVLGEFQEDFNAGAGYNSCKKCGRPVPKPLSAHVDGLGGCPEGP